MYQPHVLAVRANQPLQLVNDDATSHNIHPLPANNREWNKAEPPGSRMEEAFAREEIAIPVKRNVHPWMRGYIAVFKHPYYAVTGKDGGFDLSNLPPGTYTIKAWHEKLGSSTQTMTIGANETKEINFVFKAMSWLLLRDLEAFAALFAVAVQRVEDDGVGFRWRAYLIDLDGLAFELFVILKKAAEHEQAVRRHLRSLAVGVELGILGRDGDDFVILLAGVDHGHQADSAGVNDGQGDDRFLAQHEYIERVVVLGERLRNETVVGGIVDGRVEDAVEADQAAGFVQFILHAGAEGDFDDAVEFVGKLVAGGYVVPRMDHG
jgi:carboxypeptidase family protein